MQALLMLCALLSVGGCGATDHHEHRFADAKQWAQVFDDPARDAWQKPEQVIAALALDPHALVADIGAGTGYFAMRLARSLLNGRVFAIDIEPDMVRYLEQRAAGADIGNLRAILAAADDPRIPEPVDLILIVDTYHHIGQRLDYFKRLAPRLRANGRIVVIDFKLDSPVGPPKRHRLAPQTVIEELDRAGFALAQQHDFLSYQYFLVFRPR
jgi:cyclopropane fatty-acyl-phospholipid synthase-like methyltransferase